MLHPTLFHPIQSNVSLKRNLQIRSLYKIFYINPFRERKTVPGVLLLIQLSGIHMGMYFNEEDETLNDMNNEKMSESTGN